ncbi:HPr family phosphocarrier protein [Elusimicrobiota bacterium]
MIEKQIEIRNKLGLHARPAAVMVQTASKFKAKIKIRKDSSEVDAKSIMGIMTLAANAGSKIILVADGEDEQEAISELGKLIEAGFDE